MREVLSERGLAEHPGSCTLPVSTPRSDPAGAVGYSHKPLRCFPSVMQPSSDNQCIALVGTPSERIMYSRLINATISVLIVD